MRRECHRLLIRRVVRRGRRSRTSPASHSAPRTLPRVGCDPRQAEQRQCRQHHAGQRHHNARIGHDVRDNHDRRARKRLFGHNRVNVSGRGARACQACFFQHSAPPIATWSRMRTTCGPMCAAAAYCRRYVGVMGWGAKRRTRAGQRRKTHRR